MLLHAASLRRLESFRECISAQSSLSRRTTPRTKYSTLTVALTCCVLLGQAGLCGPLTVQNRSGVDWQVETLVLASGSDVVLDLEVCEYRLWGDAIGFTYTNRAPSMAYITLTGLDDYLASPVRSSWLESATLGFGTVAGWFLFGLMLKIVGRLRKQVPEGISG